MAKPATEQVVGQFDTDAGLSLGLAGEPFFRARITPQGGVLTGNGQSAPTALATEHPDLSAHDVLGLATQAELDAHSTATANVHGIADTALLARLNAAQTWTGGHNQVFKDSGGVTTATLFSELTQRGLNIGGGTTLPGNRLNVETDSGGYFRINSFGAIDMNSQVANQPAINLYTGSSGPAIDIRSAGHASVRLARGVGAGFYVARQLISGGGFQLFDIGPEAAPSLFFNDTGHRPVGLGSGLGALPIANLRDYLRNSQAVLMVWVGEDRTPVMARAHTTQTRPLIECRKADDTRLAGLGLTGLELRDSPVIPTANLVSGGYVYVEAGALKFRGGAGTVTTLAIA